MISSKTIKKRLKRFCGWRHVITLTDLEYAEISIKVVKKLLIDITTEGDCDDYSRELDTHIRHNNIDWPVGRVLLNKISGIKTNHSMVVALCVEGVYIIEAGQVLPFLGNGVTHKVKKAIKGSDVFYNVYI